MELQIKFMKLSDHHSDSENYRFGLLQTETEMVAKSTDRFPNSFICFKVSRL